MTTAPQIERRSVHARWELRDEPSGGIGLRGYAAVFDSEAHGEVIRSSAFTRTLDAGADVRLLIDHDGIPLARTKSGTMTLSVDEVGLVVDVPDLDMSSPRVQSLVSAMKRGDLDQMSFAFAPVAESFDSDRRVRELLDVDLFDVSVVAYPWYEATTVEVNSTPVPVEIRSTDTDSSDDEGDGDAPDDGDESENTTPITEVGDPMSDNVNAVPAEVLSEEITVAETRIADLEGRAALEDRIAALETRSAGAADKRAYDEVARVTRDERTYNPDADRRGATFLSDVVSRFTGDFDAAQRLSRHMVEERTERGSGIESRAVGTAAFGALVVPQYLTDLVAPVARAGRPTADICNRMALPSEGMTVEIPRITTGTSVAVQATQNSSVSETNLDETTLSVPVVTIAGQQTVSIQAISRGRGTEQVVVRDLVSAYNTLLDAQIIGGAAGTGEHRGILATANIKSVSWTDTSPTAAELYPKLFDLIQQVQSSVFRGVTHFLLHPRRWAWMSAQVGTTFPFLQAGSNPQGAAGQFGAPSYGGVVGNIAGVPVVLDANIATTTATNQDTIYAVSADELHLWEESGSPLYIRAEQPQSTALGVQLVVYGFSAFTAGRYPGAHGKISGAGLTVPAF